MGGDDIGNLVRRIADNDQADPGEVFNNPQHVTDCVTAPYEARLLVLQRWKVLARDAAEAASVAAAIDALEKGAAVGEDGPAEAPEAWGYGRPIANE